MGTTLPYEFHDAGLHELALSHRSLGAHNNERLEFFGDALVNMLVAELLYERYPKADEGALTRMRSHLVSEPALARLARELELGDQLHLGPGELKSGGFRRDSILADAVEALVAAVYLDGGWDACRSTVRELFAKSVAQVSPKVDKDAKTRLQELLQANGFALPLYDLIGSSGADHAKIFDVSCRIDGLDIETQGQGSSRRSAEQAAAESAISELQARLDHAG